MDQPDVFVGIDVSKASLDLAVRPSGLRLSLVYQPQALDPVAEQLRQLAPTLIVLEATGGMERPLVRALVAAALPVIVANPRQVRDFAKATGQLAKTDPLDAAVLAHFAEAVRPALRAQPDAPTPRSWPRGFTANFELLGKTFRAVESGKTFNPDDLTIVEHHRFEGSSDPEEMAVVYAIEARDGTRGTLVDAYGAYANPDLSAFLKDVPIHETN